MNVTERRKSTFVIFLGLLMFTMSAKGQDKPGIRNWYDLLPFCPCREPDFYKVVLGDGWAKDKGNVDKYHRGAASSYRSYPPVKTSEGWSCQQCCYDRLGYLITVGRGAGTPDKKSSCKGEDKNGVMSLRFWGLFGHYFADVRPWQRMMARDSSKGWMIYNVDWIPNQGQGCQVNAGEINVGNAN